MRESVNDMKKLAATPPFRLLAQQGFSPIPIVPHDKTFLDYRAKQKQGGKAPGRYDASTATWNGLSGWQRFLSEPASDHLLSRWESWPAPGLGIVTGKVVAVDIDVTEPELAESAIRSALNILGETEFVRYGREPKVMLIYRIDGEPIPKMSSAKFDLPKHPGNAIEVLGAGQQFVAYGIHPGTGQPYNWPSRSLVDASFTDLPIVTPQQLQKFIATFETVATDVFSAARKGSSRVDADNDREPAVLEDKRGMIPQALKALKNDFDYDQWIRVGMAVKAALPDDEGLAYELFDEFSAKSDKYDPDETLGRWNTLNPTRIGAGTLYHLAQEAGWKPPVALPEDDFSPVAGIPVTPARETAKRGALYYLTPEDIRLDTASNGLIDDLLDQGAMSVLYGESNTGKTFVAMDLAFHVATGRPWDNRHVEQGAVVYVAAEGGKSAQNRIEALKRVHGLTKFPLLLCPCPVDLLHANADTKPLIEMVKAAAAVVGFKVRLVVIDTLSRALAGGNENDSQDMGAFVRHVDAIRAAVDAHLLVVHHTGKDKAKGARGHSLLRAATDTELEVANRTITAMKQRDMEIGRSIGFDLKVVELGKNARGKPITSCVVETCDAAARADFESDAIRLQPREALVLNAFKELWAAAKFGYVGQFDWAERCRTFDLARVPGCEPWPEGKSFHTAFQRSREKLQQLGYVTAVADKRWAEPKPAQSSED